MGFWQSIKQWWNNEDTSSATETFLDKSVN